MSQPLSLKTVKQAFEQWRATRSHQQKIPHDLWQQVFALRDRYKISLILSTININNRQLKNALKEYNQRTDSQQKTSLFVNIPTTIKTVNPHSLIELSRSDGTTLRFSQIDQPTLMTLLQHFLGEMPCCN